jgi:hypothetical protein
MEKTKKQIEILCPICCGPQDKKSPNCFHCATCGFASCAYKAKDIPEIVKSIRGRLKEFYRKKAL